MTNRFAATLIQIRTRMGFASALKFHAFLKQSDATEINYAQYKKIESALVVARPEFVSKLVHSLNGYSAELIRAYCADLFPGHTEVFEEVHVPLPSPKTETPLLYPQKVLNPRQISIISESEVHYELYLILILARKPLLFEQLILSLPKLKRGIVKQFEDAGLVYLSEAGYSSASREWKFPDSDDPKIKAAYELMSKWELKFQHAHEFDKVYTRVLMRRISSRYIPILLKHAELLADLFRAGDEVDMAKNSTVASLSIQFKVGKLPG